MQMGLTVLATSVDWDYSPVSLSQSNALTHVCVCVCVCACVRALLSWIQAGK